MRRQLALVIGVSVACVMAPAQPAAAGFWDWLEEFSGPGPFTGYTITGTACFDGDFLAFDTTPSTSSTPIGCIYADKSWFQVDADPHQGYPEVSLTLFDIGAGLRIAGGLDLSAGFGYVGFFTNENNDPAPGNRMTITPIRIVARPIVLLGSRNRWAGVLNVHWKQTFIPGSYSGDDFGQIPPPGMPKFLSTGGELLGQFGVGIDLTPVVFKRYRIR
jgi:hypothetical protein